MPPDWPTSPAAVHDGTSPGTTHLQIDPRVLPSSSQSPGFVADALVLRVACVAPAVREDHRASEDGRVPAFRPDRYLPDRHELLAAPGAPVVSHVVSLPQPSDPRRPQWRSYRMSQPDQTANR
jgi:hypothetical protein